MAAYAIFDVEIHDMARYQEFMSAVKPAIEAAGGKNWRAVGLKKLSKGIGNRAGLSLWSSHRSPQVKHFTLVRRTNR